MDISVKSALVGMFVSAFISSALWPGGSEIVLAGLAVNEVAIPLSLMLVTNLGNTLGGMTSWFISRIAIARYPKQESGTLWPDFVPIRLGTRTYSFVLVLTGASHDGRLLPLFYTGTRRYSPGYDG